MGVPTRHLKSEKTKLTSTCTETGFRQWNDPSSLEGAWSPRAGPGHFSLTAQCVSCCGTTRLECDAFVSKTRAIPAQLSEPGELAMPTSAGGAPAGPCPSWATHHAASYFTACLPSSPPVSCEAPGQGLPPPSSSIACPAWATSDAASWFTAFLPSSPPVSREAPGVVAASTLLLHCPLPALGVEDAE